jgi:hypothetical protein
MPFKPSRTALTNPLCVGVVQRMALQMRWARECFTTSWYFATTLFHFATFLILSHQSRKGAVSYFAILYREPTVGLQSVRVVGSWPDLLGGVFMTGKNDSRQVGEGSSGYFVKCSVHPLFQEIILVSYLA